MPADATFGPANAAEPAVDDAMRTAYAQIAGRRRTVPAAVAVAFVDPAARVVRVATDDGERFVNLNRANMEGNLYVTPTPKLVEALAKSISNV